MMVTYEEVLIAMLQLSKESPDQAVQSVDVARLMHLTKAAIHNRVSKLMKRGLLVKDHQKKLHFTPNGLAYTTGLAADVTRLQGFFANTWGLSREEAQNCAFAMVSTLSEASRKRLVTSTEGHGPGSSVPCEAQG